MRWAVAVAVFAASVNCSCSRARCAPRGPALSEEARTAVPRVLLVATHGGGDHVGGVIAPLGCRLGVGEACLSLVREGLVTRAADGRIHRLGRPTRAWNCNQEIDDEPDYAVFESGERIRFSRDAQLLVTSGELPIMAEPGTRELLVDLDRDRVVDRVANNGTSVSIVNGRTGMRVVVASRGMALFLVGVADVHDDGKAEVVFREGDQYRASDIDGHDADLGFGCL